MKTLTSYMYSTHISWKEIYYGGKLVRIYYGKLSLRRYIHVNDINHRFVSSIHSILSLLDDLHHGERQGVAYIG